MAVKISLFIVFSMVTVVRVNGNCTCPSSPSNGGVHSCYHSVMNDAKIYYTCVFGYSLVGDRERTCISSQWTGRPPSCQRNTDEGSGSIDFFIIIPIGIFSLLVTCSCIGLAVALKRHIQANRRRSRNALSSAHIRPTELQIPVASQGTENHTVIGPISDLPSYVAVLKSPDRFEEVCTLQNNSDEPGRLPPYATDVSDRLPSYSADVSDRLPSYSTDVSLPNCTDLEPTDGDEVLVSADGHLPSEQRRISSTDHGLNSTTRDGYQPHWVNNPSSTTANDQLSSVDSHESS